MMRDGKIAAIVVAAGSGSRAGDGIAKQFRMLDGHPMIWHSVKAFADHRDIGPICVVIADGQQQDVADIVAGLHGVVLTTGGKTRRESVHNGLKRLQADPDIEAVLIHDAARPFLSAKVIDDVIEALDECPASVPALPVVDSLARCNGGSLLVSSESRDGLWRIQTPQAFHFDVICGAHDQWDTQAEATDDARMAMAAGYDVAIVAGDERLSKYTFASDFDSDAPHSCVMQMFRTGTGYDVHRLVRGEELWLCGIQIDHDMGLSGHSDADVALHALTDAILGAAAMGDIGEHFPPSDPQWRGASSDRFLAHAVDLVAAKGYRLCNVDVTIICESPKIGPHRDAMRQRVSEILQIDRDDVSIKATTTERLGYTGRGEGIAAQAVATLMREK